MGPVWNPLKGITWDHSSHHKELKRGRVQCGLGSGWRQGARPSNLDFGRWIVTSLGGKGAWVWEGGREVAYHWPDVVRFTSTHSLGSERQSLERRWTLLSFAQTEMLLHACIINEIDDWSSWLVFEKKLWKRCYQWHNTHADRVCPWFWKPPNGRGMKKINPCEREHKVPQKDPPGGGPWFTNFCTKRPLKVINFACLFIKNLSTDHFDYVLINARGFKQANVSKCCLFARYFFKLNPLSRTFFWSWISCQNLQKPLFYLNPLTAEPVVRGAEWALSLQGSVPLTSAHC